MSAPDVYYTCYKESILYSLQTIKSHGVGWKSFILQALIPWISEIFSIFRKKPSLSSFFLVQAIILALLL